MLLTTYPLISSCTHSGDDTLQSGDKKLNDLYASLSIVRVIKLRRVRWAGHVARVGGVERHIQVSDGET